MQILNEQLLHTLVSTLSHAPYEMDIVSILETYLKDANYNIETVHISKTRKNVLATRGQSDSYILFYGHVDTVPVIQRESWETNPYSLVKKGDRLYGLGAYDMKGGIASILSALELTNKPVKLLFCVDEERISEGAWKTITKRKDFFDDVKLIISAEPNFGLGLHGITTSRTGRCVFVVSVHGKSAHIAQYAKGKDVIKKILPLVDTLYSFQEQWEKQYGTVVLIRGIHGDSSGLSVMDTVELHIEAVIGMNDTIEQVQYRLEQIFSSQVSLKSRKTPYLSPYTFQHFPYRQIISEIITQYTKKKMKLCSRKSVSDDNVFSVLNIPVLTWGPDGANAHAPNEYVSYKSLCVLTEMYKELLDRLL